MALTGNDLSENQLILSEIFLIEHSDKLALNSINKYFIAFYVTGTGNLIGKKKHSWPQVTYSLVGEVSKQRIIIQRDKCYVL